MDEESSDDDKCNCIDCYTQPNRAFAIKEGKRETSNVAKSSGIKRGFLNKKNDVTVNKRAQETGVPATVGVPRAGLTLASFDATSKEQLPKQKTGPTRIPETIECEKIVRPEKDTDEEKIELKCTKCIEKSDAIDIINQGAFRVTCTDGCSLTLHRNCFERALGSGKKKELKSCICPTDACGCSVLKIEKSQSENPDKGSDFILWLRCEVKESERPKKDEKGKEVKKKEKDKCKRDRRDDEDTRKVGMEDYSASIQSNLLSNCAVEEKPFISIVLPTKSRDEEMKKNLVKPLPADLEARPIERKEDALMSKYAVKETNTKENKKKNKKEVRQVVLPGLSVIGQRGGTKVEDDIWGTNEVAPPTGEMNGTGASGEGLQNNDMTYENGPYGFAMPEEVYSHEVPFTRDCIGGMGGMIPPNMDKNSTHNPFQHPLPIGSGGIFRPTNMNESTPMAVVALSSQPLHDQHGRNSLSGFTESPTVDEPPLIENPFDYPTLEKDSVRERKELVNFFETHIPILEENAALFDSPQIDLDQLKNMLENFIEFQFFGNEEEKRTMISTLSNIFGGEVEKDIIPFLSDLPCFKYGYVDGRLIVSVKMEGKQRREREDLSRRERDEEVKRLRKEEEKRRDEVRKAVADLEERRQREEEGRRMIEKEEEERKKRKEEEERRMDQQLKDEKDRKVREKRRMEEEDRRQKELRRREDEEKERKAVEDKKKKHDMENKIREEKESKKLEDNKKKREDNEEREKRKIANEKGGKSMLDNQDILLEEKRKREERICEMIEEEKRIKDNEQMSSKQETDKRTKEKELERKTREAINTLRDHNQPKSPRKDADRPEGQNEEFLKCTQWTGSSSSLSPLPLVTCSTTSFSTSAPPFIPRSTNPKAELNPNATVFIPCQSAMEDNLLFDVNGAAVDTIWMDVNKQILENNKNVIDELNRRITEMEAVIKDTDEANRAKEMEMLKKDGMRMNEEQKNRDTICLLESKVRNMNELILWKEQEISKISRTAEESTKMVKEVTLKANNERREKDNVMHMMERGEEERRKRLLERKTEVARTAVIYCTDIINRLASEQDAQVMTSIFIVLRTKWIDHHSILSLQLDNQKKGENIDWEFTLSLSEPRMPREADQLVQECYVWHYQTMHILSFRLASIVKKCLREHKRHYDDAYIIGIIQKWMRIHKDPTKIEATVPQVANMVAQAMGDVPLMPSKYVYVTAPYTPSISTLPSHPLSRPSSHPVSAVSNDRMNHLRTQSSSNKNEPKGWKKASDKVRQVELENHECSICLDHTEGGDISYCEQVSCNEPYHNDCLDNYWASGGRFCPRCRTPMPPRDAYPALG